jgi:serine/threonine-protein kinase
MTASNLVGNCSEQETDDPNQVGKVISTTPQAGQQVDKGSPVQIIVGKAKAPEQVQVPGNLVGMSLKDARKTLQDTGLQVGNVSGSQDDNALVLTSDPAPGTTVDKGSAVNLVTARVTGTRRSPGPLPTGGPGSFAWGSTRDRPGDAAQCLRRDQRSSSGGVRSASTFSTRSSSPQTMYR